MQVILSVKFYKIITFLKFPFFLGVYYTKCCCDYAHKVNVFGWVKNSKKGTIVGKMQGRKNKIEKMYVIYCLLIIITQLDNLAELIKVMF